jgi:hypothetical protein
LIDKSPHVAVSAFQSEAVCDRLENLFFRLTLSISNRDIFGPDVDEEGEAKMIDDRFKSVDEALRGFFNQGEPPLPVEGKLRAPLEQARVTVAKTLAPVFSGARKYMHPNYRALNVMLFYNSREHFTENSNLMFLVSTVGKNRELIFIFSLELRLFPPLISSPDLTATRRIADAAPVDFRLQKPKAS